MPLIALKPSQRLVDIVGALGGEWRGYAATCRCPAHRDRTPSLSLRQGDRGILAHCFAGCDPRDILRELDRLQPGRSYAAPPRERLRHPPNVQRLWDQGVDIRGTLAELYCHSRRLPPGLANLRFHPRCPHGPMPLTRFKPALLVAVREADRLAAIQRIFLKPKGNGYTDKAMLGRPRNGAWRGDAVEDTLALAEGFEDAAAFSALHGIACWASLGAARLHLIDIPPQVRTLIIAEDDDVEGRAAARRAWRTYRARGLTLRRMSPRPCRDWAEALASSG